MLSTRKMGQLLEHAPSARDFTAETGKPPLQLNDDLPDDGDELDLTEDDDAEEDLLPDGDGFESKISFTDLYANDAQKKAS
jgi:hypothetical protein